MDGYLNILKPPGMSSAAVVTKCKNLCGDRTGHAGTLDPEASGVLPVMIGRATRLLDYLPEEKKIYVCEIAFAGATDTQDAQGVLTEQSRGIPDESELLEAIQHYTGDVIQIPPMYSAIKRGGIPLYKAARRGMEIDVETRRVNIQSIEMMGKCSPDSWRLRVTCSRGTYIRTLCHDIGQYLNKPAHMRFLLRTFSAGFSINESVLLEELTDINDVKNHLIRLDYPLEHIPVFHADISDKLHILNGKAIHYSGEISGIVRVYLEDRFVGIAERTGDFLKYKVICTDYSQP